MQNQSVKVERTIYVDNKLKKIYQNFDEYQDVNEADQEFFDGLFPVLWLDGHLNMPNKYLAERFGYQVTTIEKKLRKLERAHLIYRVVKRNKDDNTGKWNTTRDIFLDSVLQSRLTAELKLIPAGMAKAPEPELDVEISTRVENEEEKPTPEFESYYQKKKAPKFNFGKLNRR